MARVEAAVIEPGDRMWTIETKDGRATRWRPVKVLAVESRPLVETVDGKRFRVFRSALHWQPNKRTDLPVESHP
jgi:hypothetical protein